MALVKLYNKDGDAKAVKMQEGFEKKMGFVPEVFQAMGRSGDFLEKIMQLAEAAGKNLDPKTKELIIIAVSAANGCEYCLAAHRAMAKGAGVTDDEISAALEIAASISAFNTFNKAIGLNIDLKAE